MLAGLVPVAVLFRLARSVLFRSALPCFTRFVVVQSGLPLFGRSTGMFGFVRSTLPYLRLLCGDLIGVTSSSAEAPELFGIVRFYSEFFGFPAPLCPLFPAVFAVSVVPISPYPRRFRRRGFSLSRQHNFRPLFCLGFPPTPPSHVLSSFQGTAPSRVCFCCYIDSLSPCSVE